MKFLTFLVASLLFTQSGFAGTAQEIEDLDNRVFELEEKVQGKFPVTPIDAMKLRFGGTIHQKMAAATSEDFVGGENKLDLANETRVDLMFAGDLNKKIDFIFVPAWFYMSPRKFRDSAARDAENSRQTMQLVYRANFNYKLGGGHKLTVGRYMTPYGLYLGTYSPAADNMSTWPSMILPTGGVTFDTVLDGLKYSGSAKMGSVNLKYNTYVGVQAIDGGVFAQDPLEEYLVKGNTNELTSGIRLDFGMLNNKVNLGLNYQIGHRIKQFQVFGGDLMLNFGKFKMKAEFVKTKEANVEDGTPPNLMGAVSYPGVMSLNDDIKGYFATLLDSDKTTYYIEPMFYFSEKFMMALRYDFADYKNVFNNFGEKKVISAAFNYFPCPKLRIKFAVDKHDYESETGMNAFSDSSTTPKLNGMFNPSMAAQAADPDYMEYSLSATLSF